MDPSKMSTICRVCSDMNPTKLISLKNKTLIKFYERVCNTKLYNKDDRPKGFCNSCYQNLLAFYELVGHLWNSEFQKSDRLDKIFSMLDELGLEGTAENISMCEVELGLIPQDKVIERERA